MANLLHRIGEWLQPHQRLSPASEQILLNAGIVLPSGPRPAPSARTPEAALRSSAVYSSVKLLSETIASLPIRLVENATKRDATTHPLHQLLREPNTEQTAPEFWEMILANYFTWGSAYVEVIRRGSRIVELVPFAAGYTDTRRQNGTIQYLYTIPTTGQGLTLADEQVMPFRMFGVNDSVKSFAPIWVAQRAIELSLTQEQTAIENFADGLRPDIIIKLPPEKALQKLEDLGPNFLQEESVKIQNQIAGARTRRELYLPFGYDSTPYAANYQQSQFQETRDFQILEIARVFRVPPSKLGVISKQPNANAEQDQLSFYQDTIRPVLTKLEKRLERDLLTPQERGLYSIRFNARGILRGDIKTQTEQYTRLWQIGAITTNEIRDLEDLPPFDDERADTPNFPVNMTTEQVGGADQSGTNPEARSLAPATTSPHAASVTTHHLTDAQQRSLKGRKSAAEGVKGTFAQAVTKIVKAEKARISREAKSILDNRSRENLRDRLEQLYSNNGELTKFIRTTVQGPIHALFDAIVVELRKETGAEFSDSDLEQIVRDYIRIYVRDYTHSSLYQLLDVMDSTESDDDILSAIEQRLDEWENGTSADTPSRAEKESATETHKGNSVFTKGLYLLAGITAVQISGGTCEYCEPFQGRYSTDNSPSPPFHLGCGCDLVSA